jgi:hypothetical protein
VIAANQDAQYEHMQTPTTAAPRHACSDTVAVTVLGFALLVLGMLIIGAAQTRLAYATTCCANPAPLHPSLLPALQFDGTEHSVASTHGKTLLGHSQSLQGAPARTCRLPKGHVHVHARLLLPTKSWPR